MSAVEPIRWQVLIPVKDPAVSKSRLASPQRHELALAFLTDVLAACTASRSVAAVGLVTSDAVVAEHVPDVPVTVTPLDFNAAIAAAALEIRAHRPGTAVAVLVGDLPAVRAEDLDLALGLAAAHDRSFVSDAAGTGTTLLCAREDARLAPSFGPRSRAAHRASGAVELEHPQLARLRCDVDTTVDLWYAQALGVGEATRAVLDPAASERPAAAATAAAAAGAPTGFAATVRTFAPDTRSGTLFRDDGAVLAFDAAAFDAGGLRLLRPGQRVGVTAVDDRVVGVAIVGIDRPADPVP